MTSVGVLVIFALAAVLAIVPALTDRWAVRRGASPQTLAVLALVTLGGIAAVPVAFALCTGSLALQDGGDRATRVAGVAGLLLVAVAAGRTLARVIRMRRRWNALAGVAAALALPQEPGGASVLPLGDLLAFVCGSEAFVSQGLLEYLTPAQRRAVIEHERVHAQHGHARLLGGAGALSHGLLDIAPARRATVALERELDVLADRGAAERLGETRPVEEALHALAVPPPEQTSSNDDSAQLRIQRLASPDARTQIVDTSVRLVTVAIGAFVLSSICLALHTGTAWLGLTACTLLLASFMWFARPLLARRAVGSARGARAARRSRLALVSSRRHLKPCMRFSRSRLTDVLHRRHSAPSTPRPVRSGRDDGSVDGDQPEAVRCLG